MDALQLANGLVSGALVVPILSWLLRTIASRRRRKGRPPLTKNFKRAGAIALSFLLGVAGLLLQAEFGEVQLPASLLGWINTLSPIVTMAFTVSQVVLSGAKTYLRGIFRTEPAS